MKLFKRTFTILSVLIFPIFLISCTSNENKLEKIKTNGELVLGTSADYPPYEFPIIGDNGIETIVGFDISIAQEIADDLGVKLITKNLDFSGLLDALNSNNVDIIISGISPTEERKKSIDFSDVYYTAKNVVVTLKQNASSITSIDDLKNLNIGVLLGSIQDKVAQEKLKDSKIKSLIRVPELILELLSNKIDAIVIENPVAEQYVKTNPELTIIDIEELNSNVETGSAVGVKKNQSELLNEINKTLSRLMSQNKINEFFNEALELAESNK